MKKRRNTKARACACPTAQKSAWVYMSDEDFKSLVCAGYTTLDKNPEIMTACRMIATLIASMTIHLMANSEKGDQRIINELSRKIDINPNQYMTRSVWMEAIVMNMLLYGRGNSIVLPTTEDGLLGDMYPIDPGRVSFIGDNYSYKVLIDGKERDPADVLHFVFNPDPTTPWKGQGITAQIRDVANNLKQARATEKGFLSSKWKPSLIVKVDALTDEFASPEGRKRLVENYIETAQAGEPWVIPSEQLSVQEVRPLSLNDLAISDTAKLNKSAIAAIVGVPGFVLGVGAYNAQEWDNFIASRVRPIVKQIEQEMTRKLILSPKWYWRFNMRSLYSYDMQKIASVYSELYVRGIVDGNEVRDQLSMAPREGLDELVILENYIPLNKIADQMKLQGGADNE